MLYIISVAGGVLSAAAAAVAVVAFVRAFLHELPTVEFLARRDPNVGVLYKLSISNPTRRVLFLDCIRVLSPSTVTGFTIPGDTMGDTLRRLYYSHEAVYLEVAAGGNECLNVEFKADMDPGWDDEGFDVDFRLVWSKGLPLLVRCFMPRKVQLDSTQVKSRNIAALEPVPPEKHST